MDQEVLFDMFLGAGYGQLVDGLIVVDHQEHDLPFISYSYYLAMSSFKGRSQAVGSELVENVIAFVSDGLGTLIILSQFIDSLLIGLAG